MILTGEGIAINVPGGWDVRIGRTAADPSGVATQPLVHGATFALPEHRGEYGAGVVNLMTPEDTFVALVEFGSQSVGTALFAAQGFPRQLDPDWFHSKQLQRPLPGQAGLQRFFTEQRRAFCLYVVVGQYGNRAPLVPRINSFLAGIQVRPPLVSAAP
jgi:hypothetical protein